jgi:hypothetical protein
MSLTAHNKHVGVQDLSQEEMVEMAQENRRRRDAVHTGGASTLDDGGTCARDFKDPAQKFALINMAGPGLSPKSLVPAFRVLGLFPDRESLMEQVQMLNELKTGCDLRLIEVHNFYGIPTDIDRFELQTEKANRNLALHQRKLDADTTEFIGHKDKLTRGRASVDTRADTVDEAVHRIERNKSQLQGQDVLIVEDGAAVGEGGEMEGVEEEKHVDDEIEIKVEVEEDEEEVAAVETEEENIVTGSIYEASDEDWQRRISEKWPTGTPVPRMHRMAEVRNQNMFSFMLLQDYEDGTEPAFCILSASDAQEDALAYNKYVAGRHIDDHDLHVHRMYEWVYPSLAQEEMLSGVPQLYRNEELDNIMRQHRESKKQVSDFGRQFTSRGLDVPLIEVEQDLGAGAGTVEVDADADVDARVAPAGFEETSDVLAVGEGDVEAEMPPSDM